uniref:Signal-induced proliferation-associated 1-like protein 1 n=1 Tax=Phallusia mammillata TaxID=59560 RepID=A0A6F9DRJ9_9ASCI|nr:signal-induced proliferation-associated 1-like protein 1 [Phallusia mammillata]
MADRPHYIATTNRNVTSSSNVKPRTSPLTPPNPNQSSDEVLDFIREKARHAANYYNTVGLSNGDLITETRRRSSSPDKAVRTWSQGSSTHSTPGKYGVNWVKPRSRPTSRDAESDYPISYTLPKKGHHLSTSSESQPTNRTSKSRSKSVSHDHGDSKHLVIAKSEVKPTDERTAVIPTASVLDSENKSATLDRYPRFISKEERIKSSSLTRMGKSPYQSDDLPKVNGATRINSHLHRSNTSLNEESQDHEMHDKKAMPPPSPDSTEKARAYLTPHKLERQRSNSDARNDKRKSKEYLSMSFDSAHETGRLTMPLRCGSASSLDQAVSHESFTDAHRPTKIDSHSLPPSTKHIKKHKSDSRGTSPANSANVSPKMIRRRNKDTVRSKSDVPDHKVILSNLANVQYDVVDGVRQELGMEEERRRRHHFAHYDWQSMLFSFREVLLAMEGLKRKNTTTGASKAAALAASTDSLGSKGSSINGSMEDMSIFIEEDEGLESNKFNELVSNCPYFRNEIGGDPERIICISASGANASVSVQVGNNTDNTTTLAQKVLSNHTFLSVLESGNYESLLPPGSPQAGQVGFGIAKRDEGAHYYRLYFFDKEHQNFFGIDEKYGPVIISLRREKIEDFGIATYQYRVIIRTSELCTLRGSILEEAIHQNATKHGSGKGLPPKEVLEYVCPEVNLSCLKVAQATPKCHEQLVKVDEQNVYKSYKIGVLYCRAGQTTEEEMYNNEHASPAFEEFLAVLGDKVKLNGFNDFRGGLDVKTDSTGTESVFTAFRGYKIMFHVSTMLPFTPNNRQQLLRKRHIGNDIMTIVFQEPGSEPFNPKNIRSHFQHVFIIVRAYQPCTSNTCYRIAVTRSRNIPRFGPPIPECSMFPNSTAFREFLLTKIINGENMAHTAGKFKAMAMNTRQEYLRDLCINYTTQNGLDTNAKFGRFSISAASRKIRDNKEKQKLRPTPEILSRGALSWHVNVTDYSTSDIVPCLLGMSDCVLTIIEISSRQLIFSIPCQAVLGWTVPLPSGDLHSYKRSLHVYYGRGERVSVQIDDVESRDEIVLRLERFTKGSETVYRQLRRNAKGELGFHVNYEGIVMDVEQSGNAFQDGLRQSSRLVDINKVAVATMTHEEIIDLLRTSKVVKVVVIPPNDDGTPRKCSMELYHLSPIMEVVPVPQGMNFEPVHERAQSEPAQASNTQVYDVVDSGADVRHQRSDSYNTHAPKYRYDAVPDTSNHTADPIREVTKTKTRKSGKVKNAPVDSRMALLTTATRLAVVGLTQNYAGGRTPPRAKTLAESNGHSSASNTLSSTKSTFSNTSSHSGADIDFADGENKRTLGVANLHSASSLSTDSGLNSNNNSSSTISRASTDTPTISNRSQTNQSPLYDEIWGTPYYSLNKNSNNSNNSNTPISVPRVPRKKQPPTSGSDAIIRGVNWNAKPTKLALDTPNENSKNHAYSVECTPSAEVNRTLKVYIAGTEAHKKARFYQSQMSAPSTPAGHERPQIPVHHTHSASLQTSPTKWQTPPEPTRRNKPPSPRPRRRTVVPNTRVKTAKSGEYPYSQPSAGSSTSSDIQNTLIRLIAESSNRSSSSGKRSSPNRKSPTRSASSHGNSPTRRTPSTEISPSRFYSHNASSNSRLKMQRTVSDESLCGARVENVIQARQDNVTRTTEPPRTLYSHQVSGSVDSLAPTSGHSRYSRITAAPPPLNGNSPMLPLPDSSSWDRLLDAAKAAEVFEASSVKSVSMGTLNDVGNVEMMSPSKRNGRLYSDKRTMSMEQLYDHEFRGNQGDPNDLLRNRESPSLPDGSSFGLEEPYDYTRSVMMSQSVAEVPVPQTSHSEQRLERIEHELRLLQEKLKKEQESKKKLEKEVNILRRDNTRLQRHVVHTQPDTRHKRVKRKPKT